VSAGVRRRELGAHGAREKPSLATVLAELRATEARQRALLEVIPDLMFRFHRDGTYLEFAGDLTKLATPAEELLGSNIHEILPATVADALMRAAHSALETGDLQTAQYQLRTLSDGKLHDFEARVMRARADEVVTIVRDVTEQKRAERELLASRRRIVTAGDEERRRLERNLHDGAQQRLVTANLILHLVARDLERDPEAARGALAQAQDELAEGLAEIRQLGHGLHPALLTAEGLGSALRGLVERALIPVELALLPSGRLPEPVEVATYYVVAESIANATKHARAESVRVDIRADGEALVAEIRDEGVGGADAEGTGLRGLGDRLAVLGGRLEVESPSGGGTTVRAFIPLAQPA
jgi:PAS domain S-box-containing protein